MEKCSIWYVLEAHMEDNMSLPLENNKKSPIRPKSQKNEKVSYNPNPNTINCNMKTRIVLDQRLITSFIKSITSHCLYNIVIVVFSGGVSSSSPPPIISQYTTNSIQPLHFVRTEQWSRVAISTTLHAQTNQSRRMGTMWRHYRVQISAKVLRSQCSGRRVVLPHTYIRRQRRYCGLDVRRGLDWLATGGGIAVSVFVVSISRYRNTQTIDHYVNTVLTLLKRPLSCICILWWPYNVLVLDNIFHHVSVIERPTIQRTPENIDFLFY